MFEINICKDIHPNEYIKIDGAVNLGDQRPDNISGWHDDGDLYIQVDHLDNDAGRITLSYAVRTRKMHSFSIKIVETMEYLYFDAFALEEVVEYEESMKSLFKLRIAGEVVNKDGEQF